MSRDFKYAEVVKEIKTLINRGLNPVFVPEYVSYKFPEIHCSVINIDDIKIFVWKYPQGISHYIYIKDNN